MKQKSLARNSISFVLYKLMYVLFPLVTSAYVSHIILAGGVGKVASAQNISQYFVLTASLGIPTYGIREIAKRRENIEDRNRVFTELFIINFVSTLVCTVLYYSAVYFIWGNTDVILMYWIIGISVPLNILNVDWFYRGIEEFSYITKRSFIIRSISLLLILIFVKSTTDYYKYAGIYLIGISGNYILNYYNLKKKGVYFTSSGISFRDHFKPIVLLLCTTIATELYTMVDVTMLTFMATEETVGFYSNSMKIVRIVVTVMAAIGGVLLPRMSQYYAEGDIEKCQELTNKVLSIIIIIAIPCGIGIFMISGYIVPVLFGASFSPAINTLKIASFLIYSLVFFDLLGTQVLLTFNDENKLLIATIIGAIANIILNSILIPMYLQNGAAIASVISQALVTIVLFIFVNKRLRIEIDINSFVGIMLSGIIMLFVLYMLSFIKMNNFFHLLFSIAFGAMSYIGVLLVTKNKTAKYIIKTGSNLLSRGKTA